MAKTYLVAVNDTLRRVGVIAGDASELTTFTDTQRQREVDIVLQVWNEIVHELYDLGSLQGEVADGSITLVTDTDNYAVPTDFEQMAGDTYKTRVMVKSDGGRLFEYPGGYRQMFIDQPDRADFTEASSYWAFNLTNNTFRLDKRPTSAENGDVFNFVFDKRINLSTISDTMPFSDTVTEALQSVVAEIFRIDMHGETRDPISSIAGFKRAASLITQKKRRRRYGQKTLRPGFWLADPLEP